MRIVSVAGLAVAFVTAAHAAPALTEQQVEGVQAAVKAAECTVEDTAIKVKEDGYKANDTQCKDGVYDFFLDKDFKVTKRVKEDEQ